jgi:hypothetical protein
MVAGFVGLSSLIKLNWDAQSQSQSDKLHTVVYVFGVPAALCLFCAIAGICVAGHCCSCCDRISETNKDKLDARTRARLDEDEEQEEECGGTIAIWSLSVLVGGFLILSVFLCDWSLGAMVNNLTGVPTNDQSLYYLYWISKRFTMFSL